MQLSILSQEETLQGARAQRAALARRGLRLLRVQPAVPGVRRADPPRGGALGRLPPDLWRGRHDGRLPARDHLQGGRGAATAAPARMTAGASALRCTSAPARQARVSRSAAARRWRRATARSPRRSPPAVRAPGSPTARTWPSSSSARRRRRWPPRSRSTRAPRPTPGARAAPRRGLVVPARRPAARSCSPRGRPTARRARSWSARSAADGGTVEDVTADARRDRARRPARDRAARQHRRRSARSARGRPRPRGPLPGWT